jgi:hypothetical protein
MRLFASSHIGTAKKWIDTQPSGSFKTPENLEWAFKKPWFKQEILDSFYFQYLEICKGTNESIRDFNDRFNLLLKNLQPNFNPKNAILQHFLNSLEGTLQFTLKHRLLSSLDEAQEAACQIEESLRFNDSIHQINLLYNNDSREPNDESMVEPEPDLLEILEVECSAYPKKWSTCFTNMQNASLFSQENEPPEDIEPIEDIFATHKDEEIKFSLPQIYKYDLLEEDSPFVHHVGSIGPKYGETTPFYVTLRVNDSLLHNCVFDLDATTNVMNERVMHQLGRSISQPNTREYFAKGIIKDLNVSFHSFPDTPFTIDMLVIDALRNWGIILHKDLVENLAVNFQNLGSEVVIPHPEGGFFTLHKEPIT